MKIDGASLERLTTNFAGQLIQSEDTRHDTARQIWNGHVQRWPALVARWRGVADVMAVARFCPEHDLPASVRAAGTLWRATPSVTAALSSTSPP